MYRQEANKDVGTYSSKPLRATLQVECRTSSWILYSIFVFNKK